MEEQVAVGGDDGEGRGESVRWFGMEVVESVENGRGDLRASER